MTENVVKDQPGEGRLAHAPNNHPPVPRAKVGVVLANLGTPDATDYWSMRRYLNEFLSDKRVVDYAGWKWQPLLQLIILTKRPFSSGKAYRSIWNNEKNESPLLTTTRAQTEKMTARLKALYGDDVEVDFCMRYGNPSTESVLTRLKEKGCERIVFFPLYPQYGSPTTATANDQAFRTLMKMKWQPYIRTVPAYFDHPAYIQALANSVEEVYNGLPTRPTKLVASYHGVPERYLMEGDPYHCQCQKTTRLLREKLGFSKEEVDTAFQSQFGPEKWVGPQTVKHVAELAEQGHKHIAIMSPAFSSDCVETLEEIEEEIRDSFMEAGGETFSYIPCLNDRDDHIDALLAVINNELAGWLSVP
ncbi:ferrochelatase [Halomonas sp. ISL-60]|uniref:ferrochelatase n=1 Tax=unclassified Halomonas TaxID=2609666 RepID=UPI0007D9240D|nr:MULTISPECIES: ferrochelatase [unclassified Halomonas]MBT2773528.1 ferrochelatase [Halomonas sp. ISL-60]MBT2785434.1 ferrochelatase [Halomonas sp. ISL-106]MBT2797882.1 ferrochelatase [Halomonas sp. ISL-104]MBT2803808.1 ferrochelatase [Halomonas sp. ISL-56]OAL59284.1 ferrochelatase [Halomonas sp. ALS9]